MPTPVLEGYKVIIKVVISTSASLAVAFNMFHKNPVDCHNLFQKYEGTGWTFMQFRKWLISFLLIPSYDTPNSFQQ